MSQEASDRSALLVDAFQDLVDAAPSPPWFNANTPDYIGALARAKELLADV